MLTVNLEKRGDHYVAFNEDARNICEAISDVVSSYVGIPARSLEAAISELNEAGISVKINCRLPEQEQ